MRSWEPYLPSILESMKAECSLVPTDMTPGSARAEWAAGKCGGVGQAGGTLEGHARSGRKSWVCRLVGHVFLGGFCYWFWVAFWLFFLVMV